MGYRLTVTELAHDDIDGIVTYIAQTLDNQTAAVKFLDDLESAYENLSDNPFIYGLSALPQLRGKGYRKIVIMSYVLIYRVDEQEKAVTVARIFYGRRNYSKYL